jgi:hypothetical protein
MSKEEKEEEESGDVGVGGGCGWARGKDRPRVWAEEWDVDIILERGVE